MNVAVWQPHAGPGTRHVQEHPQGLLSALPPPRLTLADGPSSRKETRLRPLSSVGVAVCERSSGALSSPPSSTGCCPNSMSLLARGVDEGRFTLLRLKGLLSSLLRVDFLRSRGAGADWAACRWATPVCCLRQVYICTARVRGTCTYQLRGLGADWATCRQTGRICLVELQRVAQQLPECAPLELKGGWCLLRWAMAELLTEWALKHQA